MTKFQITYSEPDSFERITIELAALRVDAERYRWLRVEAISDKVPPDDFLNAQTPEEIDAAIDAAMGEKK